MKERLVRVAKWIAFPAFYLFCLGLFGYLTFPYDRLKDRLIAEVDKRGKPGQRLEIGKLTAYWLTGVEVSNVKLHLPPDEASASSLGGDFSAGAGSSKESVLAIDEAHIRLKILPLLIGRVRIEFSASAFGGEIKGSVPVGDAKGDVELAIDHVDVSKIDMIVQSVGVPIKGVATGKLTLSATDGKFAKANGELELTVADVVVSDGKTKIQGLIELPPAKLGNITIAAEAKDGILKINTLEANGTDLELVGDGKITLKESWLDALADLYVRFKFTDAYRGKNATTKSLLGEPGSAVAGLIEMQAPKMKRARRADGFYGWHIVGPFKRLKYDPSTTDLGPGSGAGAKRGKATDSPFAPAKRSTSGLPLGVSTAKPTDEDKVLPVPPTPPPPPPPPTTPPAPPPVAPAPPSPPPEPPRRAAAPEMVQPAMPPPMPAVPLPPQQEPLPPPVVPEQPAAMPEQPPPDQPAQPLP